MRTLILLPFLLILSIIVTAQQAASVDRQQVFNSFDRELNWVELQSDQMAPAPTFFQQHYQQFGLESAQDMKLEKKNQDQLGWTHHRYHQYHRGIRVEGGTYILHEKNGKVEKANGHLFGDIQINTTPALNKQEIIQKALQAYPAERYAWENRASEIILKRVRKNPNATHYPNPELVVLDRTYPERSGEYALAYKLIVQREAPVIDRRQLWYDAHTGELLLDVNMMHDFHGEEGTAITRYHGEQTITTMKDSLGNYILRDTTRGNGIETYNDDDRDTSGNRLLFRDDDNYWDNFNPAQDEVATDVHWGAAASFDYFLDHFDLESYDGEGATIISRVHFNENWNNASWNGSAMSFGDGDGSDFNPLTSIDVVAHELTHAVTEFSAGLIYSSESGALNESFSDIFGKTVEAIYAPDEFNWLIGQKFHVNPNEFLRSMENPNLGDNPDPKFYEGRHWYYGATRRAEGVHTNSGVQNFWYYLLVEGGQDVNEVGNAYDVPAIGFEKASAIAFRNLTVYLTESSNYRDAWRGSLQAARDLYGHCSEEYLAVAEAWYACGVGLPVAEDDYEIDFNELPASGCNLDEVTIEVIIYNNSCNAGLAGGTSFNVQYQIDREDIVVEQVDLSDEFAPGSTIVYQFNQTLENLEFGDYNLKVWIDMPNDPIAANNSIEYTIVNRPYQNEDFSTQERFAQVEGVCFPGLARTVVPVIRYDGCDTLPELTQIPYQVRYKDQIVNQRYRSNEPLAPLSNVPVTESLILRDPGFGDAQFQVDFPNDPISDNNTAKIFIGRADPIRRAWEEPFDDFQLDSTRLAVEPADASRNAIQEIDGSHQLILTGGNVLNEEGQILVNAAGDRDGFFAANVDYHTQLHLCFNFRNHNTPAFLFDYQHTLSDTDWEALNVNPDYATMLMVRVNGVMDTILFGDDLSTEKQTYYLDLIDYAGESPEVDIVGLALKASIDSTTNTINLTGDNIILDNLRLDLSPRTSTRDYTLNSTVNIFPNPSSNSFVLSKTDGINLTKMQVRLMDVNGRILSNNIITKSATTYEFGNDLSPGVYFLQLIDGEESGYFKLIKQ